MLKKVSVFLLAATLLLAGILPGSVIAANGITYLLSDSFNHYPTGSAPTGWSLNSSGGPIIAVEVPNAIEKSLKLTKSTANAGFSAAHKKLSAPQTSGVITYDTWVMTPDTQSSAQNKKFLILWDQNQTRIPFKITLDNDKIMINDSTLVQSFVPTKWIHIVAKLNIDTKKIDLTINDVNKGTYNFYDTNATSVGEVLFSVHPGLMGTLYVNYFGVTKTDPQPAANPTFFGVVPTESFRIADDEWARYQEMGIQSLRIHLQHDQNWQDIGNVVSKANDLGIEVMMLVSYDSYDSNGQWGTAPWGGRVLKYPYSDAQELIEVLEDAVPYFSALGVTSWEIWNEQNGYWNIAANDYAKLIGEIYAKFKYGNNPWDPQATIVFGGIDAVNVGDRNGINFGAREYVEAFYESAEYAAFKAQYGRSPFDALAIHPYNTVAVNSSNQLTYNYLQSSITGVALELTRANGDGNIPIWITELGSEQTNDSRQAAELRAYVESAYAMPEVQRFHYFQYVYPGENWGLVNWDRTPRQSLYEYRDVINQFHS